MLYKIAKINNIKQLHHTSSPDHNFVPLNLVYGNNGAGKSTICKIFNHLNKRDFSLIDKLKSIECQENEIADLNLLFSDKGTVTSYSRKNIGDLPWSFRVFDQDFIDNNVYTGAKIASSNLKNYHDFCLGDASVEKQNEINELKKQNESNANPSNILKAAIESKFHSNLDIKKIIKIKANKSADEKIEKLNKRISDLSEITALKSRARPQNIEYSSASIDLSFFNVSLDALSKTAKDKVDEHIQIHMKERDVGWLEDGLSLVTDSGGCPFCAQSLNTSPVFSMFKEFLGHEYENAVSNFEEHSSNHYLKLSAEVKKLEKIKSIIDSNTIVIDSWRDKVKINLVELDVSSFISKFYDVNECLDRAIQAKMKDIFSIIDVENLNSGYKTLLGSIDFSSYMQSVITASEQIDSYLLTLDQANVSEIQKDIDNLNNSKIRYQDETIVKAIKSFEDFESKRKSNEARIKVLRSEVASEQEELIAAHKDEVNNLLAGFNSNIRIMDIDRDNKASGGNTRFKFKIAFLGRELALENELDSQFLLTEALSMGDKSALALAFFLSKFKSKINKSDIIIFDDPMSSLDSHRRNTTILELSDLMNRGAQVFVFSHDAYFLSDMRKYASNSANSKCFELAVSINDLDPYNVNSSKIFKSKIIHKNNFDNYVRNSYELEYKTLYSFVENPTDEDRVNIARLIRPILEAYMRMHLPNHFTEGHWLGDMIKAIRDETDVNSILYDSTNCLKQIEQINEFSKKYHHSDGFDTKVRELNTQELHGVAKNTLMFITGL
ncbi:AAA family ATPase [Yersinia enterocolitica]|uniref:AAA family ATPase n=1 Tax=Yersinia enterocolitica TaxID=630 RepID=UPI003F486A36